MHTKQGPSSDNRLYAPGSQPFKANDGLGDSKKGKNSALESIAGYVYGGGSCGWLSYSELRQNIHGGAMQHDSEE